MHAFYTLLSYYTHFNIMHLLSLTMHGLVTGNTLLTAVAASRSKALIWSVSATSRAVLPSYWHQKRKTITNLAYSINTTTTINKSIRPNRSQKLSLQNHHAITITLYIHTYVTNIQYHQSMSSPRKLQHHHCCYHASLHLLGHQTITPATSFTA
jgi:hypothetical protein